MSDDDGEPKSRPVSLTAEALGRRMLPKRFYKTVSIADAPGGYRVLLDGRPLRTPAKALVESARHDIAEALAAEWRAQGEQIDPASMPMTRLLNSALDGVRGREAEVAAEIVRYAMSDLVCYRASGPESLVAAQARHWDPLVEWASSLLGVALKLGEGVVAVPQAPETPAAMSALLAPLDALTLAGMHVMTTLTGSAVIALAVHLGHSTSEDAWGAAHVDEDWQAAQWGSDEEAGRRRANRWRDMQAAALAARVERPPAPT